MERVHPEPTGKGSASKITDWESRKRIFYRDDAGRLNTAEIRGQISVFLAEAVAYSVDKRGQPGVIDPALAKKFREWFESLPDAADPCAANDDETPPAPGP